MLDLYVLRTRPLILLICRTGLDTAANDMRKFTQPIPLLWIAGIDFNGLLLAQKCGQHLIGASQFSGYSAQLVGTRRCCGDGGIDQQALRDRLGYPRLTTNSSGCSKERSHLCEDVLLRSLGTGQFNDQRCQRVEPMQLPRFDVVGQGAVIARRHNDRRLER